MKRFLGLVLSMWLLFAQTGAVIAQDIPTGKFLGSYYNGKNFESFVFTREDPLINFNWWRGSPGPGVSKDNFSVRWQGRFDFTAGDWEFAVSADDGVRVYIDGTLSFDYWQLQRGNFQKSVKNMSAGSHLIVVEYFENAEWAGVTLNWKKLTAAVSPGAATVKPGTVVPTTSPLYNSLYQSSCEDLTLNPLGGEAPLEVEFSGAGYDPYGVIQSYIFDFGEGTSASKVTQEDSYASYVYNTPGVFNVTLTIKDSKGNLRTADVCKQKVTVGGYYKEGIGGYADPAVIPATVSSLPKTGIFDTNLWLIFITVPMAGLGLLLNRKFSKF
ncbi:MAG: PA14 domain protein [Candidatus Shapirobacteria bacterium GW2011_GWE1_38_10]|uniref:PA14 domain protein n=4 Tax=Microgenomates group TaxID=1794810 RepID=A0A0G0KW46_9BACT|nr:MAG: PA14 domain protein [Candidatus Woesebacteria bacterium GW2011_GWD1_38_10]KKQ48490.1 MAG: PA14 domain protein [Candidatus Shapirobacteria bacterium GW2011_GWE1_38_10]KKQ83042.1 MAG: PA14 domain protein [Candidatus Woesebacteria bacterium GW2011_GWA1_38_8]